MSSHQKLNLLTSLVREDLFLSEIHNKLGMRICQVLKIVSAESESPARQTFHGTYQTSLIQLYDHKKTKQISSVNTYQAPENYKCAWRKIYHTHLCIYRGITGRQQSLSTIIKSPLANGVSRIHGNSCRKYKVVTNNKIYIIDYYYSLVAKNQDNVPICYKTGS